MIQQEFIREVKSGDRFEFGKNWQSFLNSLSDEKIEIAKQSLKDMLKVNNLSGKSFLDIGCGSGLFSMAAIMLKAKVHSIDFDPISVKCARLLNEKFINDNTDWKIQQESILNTEFIEDLPKFDIVYSWGVLHHTGNMKLALQNAIIPVKENGVLFISIYDDQGKKSQFWLNVKKIYNSSIIGKLTIKVIFYTYFSLRYFITDLIRLKNPYTRYKEYRKKRGMSMVHDWKDWLGGLPFEVATPDYIIDFYVKRGFSLQKLKSNRGGCNQFVFKKIEM